MKFAVLLVQTANSQDGRRQPVDEKVLRSMVSAMALCMVQPLEAKMQRLSDTGERARELHSKSSQHYS